MTFFKKKSLLPDVQINQVLFSPQFLQLTLNHKRPKQHQNQVSLSVIVLNNANSYIYLDFWDIFA